MAASATDSDVTGAAYEEHLQRVTRQEASHQQLGARRAEPHRADVISAALGRLDRQVVGQRLADRLQQHQSKCCTDTYVHVRTRIFSGVSTNRTAVIGKS